MDDLDRMFRRLVQNVRSSYPEYLARSFRVSELYQTIIPYRHNRGELGIEMNQDYEVALMRLLSGERGYLGGDAVMQVSLRDELAAPNPDTTSYKLHGTALIALAPEAVRRLDQYLAGRPGTPDDARLAVATPRSVAAQAATPMAQPLTTRSLSPPQDELGVASSMRGGATPAMRREGGGAPAPMQAAAATGAADLPSATCRYCAGALPLGGGRKVIFCPHCGQNLSVQHCPACSTELELGWKFCTTCGRRVSGQ
jgi:hypothetical protein